MPRPARSGKPKVKVPQTRAPEGSSARGAEPEVSVRMLVGAHAGQVVRVSRGQAVRMCEGWQPQAELVAVNRSETRETR